MPSDYPSNCRRDKEAEAGNLLDRYLKGPEDRYKSRQNSCNNTLMSLRCERRWFSGRLEISTMVVHPAYWQRGHASELTRWCTALAEVDHTGIGVSATPMGRKLFSHMGFKEKEVVDIEGYSGHPESISLWIGVRDPDMEEGKRSMS